MSREPRVDWLAGGRVTPVRYCLAARLAEGDTGSRVVIRWRHPAGDQDSLGDHGQARRSPSATGLARRARSFRYFLLAPCEQNLKTYS